VGCASRGKHRSRSMDCYPGKQKSVFVTDTCRQGKDSETERTQIGGKGRHTEGIAHEEGGCEGNRRFEGRKGNGYGMILGVSRAGVKSQEEGVRV